MVDTLNKFSSHTIAILMVMLLLTVTGCTTPSGQQAAFNPIDPYEHINRKFYAFNDTVDDYIAKPIANTYQDYVPGVIQQSITNFFNNLQDINVVFNDLLQAKFTQGGEDTGRFLMNTTIGLGGFVDVATKVGLEQHEEDFEQTLAVWGVPQGHYLVLPFIGPITYRGIPGGVFDTAANPLTYATPPFLSRAIGLPIQATYLVDRRAKADGSIQFINEAALDPYVFMRESFLQWRKHLANDGKAEPADVLDLDSDEGK